jgi:hypothetical protein
MINQVASCTWAAATATGPFAAAFLAVAALGLAVLDLAAAFGLAGVATLGLAAALALVAAVLATVVAVMGSATTLASPGVGCRLHCHMPSIRSHD